MRHVLPALKLMISLNFEEYKQKSGQDKPAKIIVVAQQNEYNNKIEDSSTAMKEYEMNKR